MEISGVHVGILVLNRNMKDMTMSLIKSIITNTKGVDYSLIALDADSREEERVTTDDLIQVSGDHPRWHTVSELPLFGNPRWAKAFDTGIDYMLQWESTTGFPRFTHFWTLCNDAQLQNGIDTATILVRSLPEDGALIHPYQGTYPHNHSQGMGTGNKAARPSSFVEFVCPMISRKFYDACCDNFQTGPIGSHFPYGWGVDYEMTFMGHELKMKSYICEQVGITHMPGTTHLNHEKTLVEDNNIMRVAARNTMLDVLEQRWGRNWGERFINSARACGVDPGPFMEWSSYDRQLAIRGARV